MRTVLSLLPVALLSMLTACSHASDVSLHTPTEDAAPAHPATLAETEIAAHRANELGVDLWKQAMGDGKSNLAMSPASIASAFAMTYLGAKGETADEMKKVLHLDGSPEAVASAYATLLASWKADKGVDLAIANRLFGEKTTNFASPFLGLTRDAFGAELSSLDFRSNAEPSRVAMNQWVAERTHDKIQDLLPQGSITGDTRLVLVNAMYFKGSWATAFKASATSDASFTTASGTTVTVPMMHQTAELKYSEDKGVRVVELPYAGGDLAMDIVLPSDAKALAALEASLTATSLEEMVARGFETEVQVSLPRFHVAPPAMSLKKSLKALGMTKSFTADVADFSGMNGARDLFIDDVFHKAFVDVNEKGTEAAAATAVVMAKESAMMTPHALNADHPFLFVLRDLHTKGILFLGRVADPTR